MDRLNIQLVSAKIILGVGEDLTRCLDFCEGWMDVAGYDRGVVDEVQESTGMFREDNLLLGTLDGGSEVVVISFLKLLTSLCWVSNARETSGELYSRCCSAAPLQPNSVLLRGQAPARAVRS
jgi:hypothetical protein